MIIWVIWWLFGVIIWLIIWWLFLIICFSYLIIIWWLFELLFDDYLWLYDDYLTQIICDYLWLFEKWLFVIIWWLFDIDYSWLFDPNYLWLFDDYLPFCCSGACRSPQAGWMRDAPAGASAACCRSRPRPFPCHSGPAYIVSNRLSASPGAIENQTQSHWKDLRRRLPRRQLCGRMIYLVPGHERQPAIGRNPPLWLVAEGLLWKFK